MYRDLKQLECKMNIVKLYKEFKQILILGGIPGWLLLGYYVVQIVFARTKSDIAAVDGTAVIYATYALGAGIYCFHDLTKDTFSHLFFSKMMKKTCISWFVLYTILCALSALWSPILPLSGYRALECMGMMLLNASVIKNLIKNLEVKGIMLWSVTYAFVMMAFTAISYARAGLGIMLYALQFPSTIFFYLAFYYAPKKIMKYPMLITAILSRSTTGYLGIAAGLCSFMFGQKKYRIWGWIIILGVGISIATVGIEDVLNHTVFAAKGGAFENGKIDEGKTSGRTQLWGPAIETVIADGKEWYGYGFVAGETMFVQNVIGGQVIGMHNGFLSAFVGTGYIGLFFFCLFMFGYARSVFFSPIPKQYKALLIATFCCVFIHTLANPGLGFRVYGTWMPAMYFVMLTVGLNIKYKYMQKYTPPCAIVINNKNSMKILIHNEK